MSKPARLVLALIVCALAIGAIVLVANLDASPDEEDMTATEEQTYDDAERRDDLDGY